MSLLKKFTFVLVALAMLAALATPAYAATTASRVFAKSVVEDKSVTLVGSSLLVNTRYNVYLSKFGKYPSGAKLVGFALTDDKGAFTKTFNILASSSMSPRSASTSPAAAEMPHPTGSSMPPPPATPAEKGLRTSASLSRPSKRTTG